MLNEEQYGFLSRHGVFARSRNIRFLIDEAIAKEKEQSIYILPNKILLGEAEKLEKEFHKLEIIACSCIKKTE